MVQHVALGVGRVLFGGFGFAPCFDTSPCFTGKSLAFATSTAFDTGKSVTLCVPPSPAPVPPAPDADGAFDADGAERSPSTCCGGGMRGGAGRSVIHGTMMVQEQLATLLESVAAEQTTQ